MNKSTIGARGIKLVLEYVLSVNDMLIKHNKELNETDIKIKTIKTIGDSKQNVRIS